MKKRTSAVPVRFRPLGLSLAILASGVMYGIFPLIPLILVIIAVIRKPSFTFDLSLIGGTLGAINMLLGVITLVTCVPAWIGRPNYSRWALIVMVWIDAAIVVYRLALINQPYACFNTACPEIRIVEPILYCMVAIVVAVSLYVTWYMNRAPAREFYRG
ncbi:MAG TPA: hypothetical protein VMT34_17855 [Aggregatilineales bacterium]|nr:hypothetical protein [Aggregatilineales bacterium]